MKKVLLSALFSVGLLAGGDLPEIEPVEYITVGVDPEPSPFYIGIGVGSDIEKEWDGNYDYSNLSVLAGAIVAREGSLDLSIEGRAAWSFDEYGVDSYGIYLKPELDTDKSFKVFGLLGYQSLTTYDYDYDAIGIGIGGIIAFGDSLGVQVDYVYSILDEDVFGFTPEYGNLTASVLYKF